MWSKERWQQFERKLSETEWQEFVCAEQAFRHSIATKPYKAKVEYLHVNPIKWWKVSRLIYTHFHREKEFQQVRHNGTDYSLQELKFTKRSLDKFPIEVPEIEVQSQENECDCLT